MPFDAHKNLAIASVATAPSPATSGLTLTLAAGEGARMPAVPFNATVWSASTLPTPLSAEIVRVTAMTGDAITAMLRAQEGTTARAVIIGDLFAATVTVKALTDIESGANFGAASFTGNVNGLHTVGVTNASAAAGAMAQVKVDAGGSIGTLTAFAPTHATAPGQTQIAAAGPGGLALQANDAAAPIRFVMANTERGRVHPSGGFSWGSTTDPGASNLRVAGSIQTNAGIVTATNPGADTASLSVSGSGAIDVNRGPFFFLYGAQSAAPGIMQFVAGNPGAIEFYSGPSVLRGKIHASGGLSWGTSTDPGPGTIYSVVPTVGIPNLILLGPGVGQNFPITFQNANGQVGYIGTLASATTYSTTSDARLKTPLGRHTDPSVLRDTVIHNFLWTKDGTKGHGVFAQEAVTVAPFAVSVGSDERDEHGNLRHPWGVDYSKYVPDLIAGWQHHDGELIKLQTELHAIRESVNAGISVSRITPRYGTTDPPPSGGATWFSRVRDVIVAWLFPKGSAWV